MARITFINTDPSDASTRQREVSLSEVRSHAARVAHHRLRKQYDQCGRPLLENAHAVPASAYVDGCGKRTKRLGSRKQPLPHTHCLPSKAFVTNIGPKSVLDELHFDQFTQQGEWDESESAAVRSVRSTTPVNRSLCLETDAISRLFICVSKASSTPFCTMWKVLDIYTDEWCQLLADEAFFHMGAAVLKYEYAQLVNPWDHAPSAVLFHKIQAFKIIRERLRASNGKVDTMTLMAMMSMPFCEDLNKASQVSKIHWAAVSKILANCAEERFREEGPVAEQFRRTFLQINTFSKLYTGTALLAEEPEREEAIDVSLSPGASELYKLPNVAPILPKGFRALADQHVIGSTALQVIQNVLSIVELGPQGETKIRVEKIRPAENLQMLSLIEAWHLHKVQPSTLVDEPSIEEIVCGAVIMYSARALGPLAFVGSLLRATRAIISLRMVECLSPRSGEEEHILFWTCMVMVESWRTRLDDLTLEGVEVRDFMLKRFPWATSSEISLPVLKLFFWDEQLLTNYERFIKPCGNIFGLEFYD